MGHGGEGRSGAMRDREVEDAAERFVLGAKLGDTVLGVVVREENVLRTGIESGLSTRNMQCSIRLAELMRNF